MTEAYDPEVPKHGTLAADLADFQLALASFRRDMQASLPADMEPISADSGIDVGAFAGATAQAAVSIRENCDSILDRLQDLDADLYQKVETEIIRIYETSAFNDLAAHNLRQIGMNLWKVESKLAHILQLLREQPDQNIINTCFSDPGQDKKSSLSQAAIDSLVRKLEGEGGAV